MTHVTFIEIAAEYVADTLDGASLESFELHMMDCPKCLADVELRTLCLNPTRSYKH